MTDVGYLSSVPAIVGPLTPPDRDLLRRADEEVGRKLRKQANVLYEQVAARLETYNDDRRREWVEAVCGFALDRDDAHTHDGWRRTKRFFPYPLFVRIVLPELRRGYAAQRPSYARWLGSLSDRIFNAGDAAQEVADVGRERYLQDALAVDPADALARRRLIDHYSGWIEYALHEIPLGVLAEPDELIELLDEFEDLVEAQGVQDEFRDDVAAWRFHAVAWRDYRRDPDGTTNYEAFLRRRGWSEADAT